MEALTRFCAWRRLVLLNLWIFTYWSSSSKFLRFGRLHISNIHKPFNSRSPSPTRTHETHQQEDPYQDIVFHPACQSCLDLPGWCMRRNQWDLYSYIERRHFKKDSPTCLWLLARCEPVLDRDSCVLCLVNPLQWYYYLSWGCDCLLCDWACRVSPPPV